MEHRQAPDIIMDILKDYGMVDGGSRPLLDYLNELMTVYSDMEKQFYELSLWQEDMKIDMREMHKTIKQLKDDKEE